MGNHFCFGCEMARKPTISSASPGYQDPNGLRSILEEAYAKGSERDSLVKVESCERVPKCQSLRCVRFLLIQLELAEPWEHCLRDQPLGSKNDRCRSSHIEHQSRLPFIFEAVTIILNHGSVPRHQGNAKGYQRIARLTRILLHGAIGTMEPAFTNSGMVSNSTGTLTHASPSMRSLFQKFHQPPFGRYTFRSVACF